MASFIEVPAHDIESFLSVRKFTRTVQRSEVVFVRESSRLSHLKIKVYTSIHDGQATVRAAGKDAIRVCVVYDDGRKSFGVGKFSPVLRVASVESVMGRLKERLLQAAERGNQWLDQQQPLTPQQEDAVEERHELPPADDAPLVEILKPTFLDEVPDFLK